MASIGKKIRVIEGKMYQSGQFWKDKVFGLMAEFLLKRGISANHVTFFRFFLIIPIVALLKVMPWLALVLILVCFYCDGLDGTMARRSKIQFKSGKWLDMVTDNLFTVIFALATIWYGYLDGFWGALHLVMFMLNFGICAYNHQIEFEDMPFFKSIYFYYFSYLILILGGANYFDYVAVFFGIYLAVKNSLLLYELFWKMKKNEKK